MTNLSRGERTTPDAPPDQEEQRSALARLLFVLGAGLVLALVTHTIRTVAVVSALIFCIFLHELGHYVAAKWGHMKVTEFFIGFGPRLWSIKRGGTEYGVKGIPAGAYVKVIGMNNLDKVDDPADEPSTYRQQSYPKRLAVGVAGSFMHFVVAFLLLVMVNAVIGQPQRTMVVGEISKLVTGKSPAQEAGFQKGDRIISVDGKRFTKWDALPAYIQQRPNQDIVFVVDRNGQQIELAAHTVDLHSVRVQGMTIADRPTGFVGIGPQIKMARLSPPRAVAQSVGDFGYVMKETFKALGHIFSPSGARDYLHTLSGKDAPEPGRQVRFLSPVGFVRVASQAASTGVYEVFQLLILINIFVGVFNLVPLLPLDGGHVAVATYEAIVSRVKRRKYIADVSKLMPVTYLVFLFLVFLGVSSLYLDLVRPSPNPFR